MPLSTNTVDTDSQVPKSLLHCPKSHMMLSANRPHQLRVPLKATQANKVRLSHNNSLELSHLHQTNFLHTTLRTHNSAMRTTATTSNSMDCNNLRKASRMVRLSNDHSVDTTVLKLKEPLNFHRAQLNKLHLVMQLPLAKEVATTLLTQLLKHNSRELVKAHNLNSLVTHSNLKPVTIHTVTLTTLAHIMLRT
jgi:hypothetical protein